jgi:hypothetical protein
MRRQLLCLLLICAVSDCSRWHSGGADVSGCSLPAPDDVHEPLFAFGRSLLTDSVWAELRRSEGLKGSPSSVRWVEDGRACRSFAEALAAANGRPVDRSMPISAVHVGTFYLVRFGMSSEPWLVGPDFRLRNAFVVPD